MFRTVLGTNKERCNFIFPQKWILSCLLCTDIVDVFAIQHIQRLFSDMHFALNIKDFASFRYSNETEINFTQERQSIPICLQFVHLWTICRIAIYMLQLRQT